MKKFILLALVMLLPVGCLVGQNKRQFSLFHNLDEFTLTENSSGELLVSSTKHALTYKTDVNGIVLPYLGINVLVSPSEEFVSVELLKTTELVRENVELAPNPLNPPTSTLCNTITLGVIDLYNQEANPTQDIEYTGSGVMGGYKILSFIVSPFSYNAASKKLYFNSNSVLKLSTSGTQSIGKKGNMESSVKEMVINIDEVERLYPESPKREVQFGPNFSMYQYIIITNNDMKSTFQKLAEWKSRKGVPALVLTTEEISSNGDSLQSKIKNVLYNYYESTEQELTYVLLGGDVEIVPTQICYARNGNVITNMPTDLYYACYDTMNWDTNGNGVYGEISDNVDILPEVYLSRASVSCVSEAETFVNRIISYESSPIYGENAKKIMMAGRYTNGLTSSPNGLVSDTQYKSEWLYNEYVAPYWNGTKVRFYDTATDFPGGATYDYSSTNMQTQLGSGYGFLHVLSHGRPHRWEMEPISDYYSLYEASNLNNTGETIILTAACLTNAFDSLSTCLSESFMRNPNSGILAFVGSSRGGWSLTSYEDMGYSNKINGEILKRFFTLSDNNFARCVMGGKCEFYSFCNSYNNAYRWLLFGVNPMGDPEMPIFISAPQSFSNVSLTYDNSGLYINPQVNNYRVCISGRDNTCYIFQDVMFPFQWSALLDGEYNACITKSGYIPYNQIFSVNHGIYIQNETFQYNVDVVGSNVNIGSNVKPSSTQGPVVIEKGITSIKNHDGVFIKKDFEVKKGAVFEIKQ